MKKKSSWKYNSVLFLLVIVLLFSIAFALKTETASKSKEISSASEVTNENISVTLKIIANEDDISRESTVFDISKENVTVEYNNNYDFGVFIESINGIKNGDDGKYWQYYINGKLGDVAVDKKNLEAGDEVEWRFEEVPFDL